MSDAPPSRYKVIERDRRLTVIDTWASAEVPSAPVTAPIRKTAFDGRAILTTRPFYDQKGPRAIALSPGDATMVASARFVLWTALIVLLLVAIAYPWVLLAPAAIFSQARFWRRARGWTTAWLDRADDGGAPQ